MANLEEYVDLDQLAIWKTTLEQYNVECLDYINEFIELSLPTSEKQFVGNIPFSSKLVLDKDNVLVGIQWFNVKNGRVDLDLKIISNECVIGWNADYKNGEKLINSAEDSLEEHNCTHIRNILKNFFCC